LIVGQIEPCLARPPTLGASFSVLAS
jgi:hypothetical protein